MNSVLDSMRREGSLGTWAYFDAEMGMPNSFIGNFLFRDHIDLHSTIGFGYNLPAYWERKDVGMQTMARWGK